MKIKTKIKYILLSILTSFLCIILLIAYDIIKTKQEIKEYKNNPLNIFIEENCSKYYEGKYEYEGYRIDFDEKSIRVSFEHINSPDFSLNDVYNIYSELYKYLFDEKVEEYKEYTLYLWFGRFGRGFSVGDITLHKNEITLYYDHKLNVRELAQLFPEAVSVSCSELIYDSIDELKGFHNLEKLHIDTKITREEALNIQEMFPECKLTWYLMDEINMVDGYYVYPVTQEEVEDHYSDGREKCKIPKTLLERLTAEQLAQAVVDYPYLYNDISTLGGSVDTSAMNFYCNAYAELIKREDGKQAIVEKLKELEQTEYDRYNLYLLKQLLLAEKSFINTYTDEELEYLSN